MSGSRGFRRTSKTPGGYKSEPNGRIHMYDKTYIGFVKDNRDAIRMGRLRVWIPEFSSNPNDEDRWYTVNYCSPFAGATRSRDLVEGDITKAQQSYGFWAVPPDLDNEVVVMFINGDPNRGIWVGCLYQQFMNHMVPGIASNTSHQGQVDGVNPPVMEYNKRNSEAREITNNPNRPRFEPLHKGLFNEGLYLDPVRGPSTASARRTEFYEPNSGESASEKKIEGADTAGAATPIEQQPDGSTKPLDTQESESGVPPALVYGLKTPKGSHLYIDDGGQGVIRLRTSNGAQILINDEVGYIYMISRNGNSWFQVSDDGIDMYSAKSISMRAYEDINIHADGNINQYATGTMNQVGQRGGTASFRGGYNMLTDQLNLTSAGSVNIYSPTRVSISGPSVGIAATSDIGITAGGSLGITSSGELSLVGSRIKNNAGRGPQAKVEPIQQSGSSGGSAGSTGSGSAGGSGSGGSGGGASGSSGGTFGPGGLSGPVAPPAAGSGERALQALRWFMSPAGGGYTKAQAAGIVGNLQVESFERLDHRARGDSGRAYGIAQWRDDRASGNRQGVFYRVYRKPITASTFEEQLAFVTYELKEFGYLGDRELRQANTASQAALVFMQKFERPSSNPSVNKIALRQQYANRLVNSDVPDNAPTPEEEVTNGGLPTSGGANENGPQVAPPPPEPVGGVDIAPPIEAATPRPVGLNDRELNAEAQYPEIQTFTTVSRLVTHEPFDLHPTGSTPPVKGAPGNGSVAVENEGGEDGTIVPINQDVPIQDDDQVWVYPVTGLGGSPFGMRTHPTLGGRRMHTGFDVRRTPVGTPIYAAKGGTVIYSGNKGGYGNTVIIQHDSGLTTMYAHCSKLHVRSGTKVSGGQRIASIGSTGRSTGPHLHFEIRGKNNVPIDPARIFPKMKRNVQMKGGEPVPRSK